MFSQIAAMFAAFVPKSIIEKNVRPALVYAGSKDDVRQWIGIRVLVTILIFAIMFLIPFGALPAFALLFSIDFLYLDFFSRLLFAIILGLIGAVTTSVIFYMHLFYVIDGRKKMVENILPDFLFLVGNNLKSGMAPFYAFRSAVRPEFGPLSEEIKIATQKSLGIESFSEALKIIGSRIDSKVLSDTTKFFAQALHSGGHLAQLIETTASDIKQTNRLKNELVTSTKMYTLFILFVVVIASPMLIAVSIQFLTILGGIQTKTQDLGGSGSTTMAAQTGLAMSSISITPEFMQTIGYFLIITNSLLASIFIGILSGGKIRDGLKYAPLMAITGLVLLTIFVQIIGGVIHGFV